MKTLSILALVAFGFGTQIAAAGDSSWVLCENGSLVVNALEHRAENSTRSVSYAMIFGARVLKGELHESKTRVVLVEDPRARTRSYFKGALEMPGDMSQVRVKGVLVLDGVQVKQIDESLSCKPMDNY